MKLIDKDVLVAEIERRIKSLNKDRDFNYLQIKELEALLSFLNTLETKEVDLEKEVEIFVQTKEFIESTESPAIVIAKHFFELGAQKGE